ncbi:DsbA family protein [Kibdelosporangium philippinense]|uniref:DsbA family protein n=2 Tax=Kibdelosporangium philippinense TaxID=211113 RepID=A0ABS8ZBI6_9PSEU|nr:DsbA family protein [Kibdelosporangium philippinense]MCE7004393.1 DsbA family protein [Kibdelosporangium philippinense]
MAVVEHWFDFICPYCYVGQDRTKILREHGLTVAEHGMQIHPEVGPGGVVIGPRTGPRYDRLSAEAEAAGLPLNWTDRIGYSRPALAAFEWLKQTDPAVAGRFAESVFTAYFAERQDIESAELLAELAKEAGGDLTGLTSEALDQSEASARANGVDGTPTWIADGQKLSGLRPREWFERWAAFLATE